jgi:hypothetical protein
VRTKRVIGQVGKIQRCGKRRSNEKIEKQTRFDGQSDFRQMLKVGKDEGISRDFLAVKEDAINCRLRD